MRFNEVSKEAQVALMSSALAGVIEAFTRDEDDEGRKILVMALKQVGLTVDEFGALISDLSPEVELEIVRVMEAADAEADEEDEDSELTTMEERPGNLNDAPNINADGWENLKDE
ncbi:hypothetical protein pEaSNUABM22_00322 [Erwinia phage pEa_SNUABM_22]|uniref:Uncharacterized protein n=1 Tax=Erwinia phage pEa_SNUABM_22 TaxID=2869549 RepID=A0AAE8XRP7_9CAUD|nr:hypothetical protein MPK63_gp321 [Erwinia phage pEa_SNUABM_22]UAW96809.1 hypothetical protein pEaSNUABM22_00322 [Erwinia phage pEa_SNUABM_22]